MSDLWMTNDDEGAAPVSVFDPMEAAGLFAVERVPVSLSDRFRWPPISVLDRRSGAWQERRREWLSLGIQSEIGRADDLTFSTTPGTFMDQAFQAAGGGTSTFDPVTCELAYVWFSPHGGRVLDPFAGGSVRGIVASKLGRWYTGVDLSAEQNAANRAQRHIADPAFLPRWHTGNSLQLATLMAAADPYAEYDLVFSCPPYADLEVYSKDPADLSNMEWPDFKAAYAQVIAQATQLLRRDRFAVWVIGEVRDKRTGLCRGLVAETVRAFQAAGLHLYNELMTVDPIGTASVRAGAYFTSNRKIARSHQSFLVFVKGDPKAAAAACKQGG